MCDLGEKKNRGLSDGPVYLAEGRGDMKVSASYTDTPNKSGLTSEHTTVPSLSPFQNVLIINLQNITTIGAKKARFGCFPSNGIFFFSILLICAEQRRTLMPNQMLKRFCLKTSIRIVWVCDTSFKGKLFMI